MIDIATADPVNEAFQNWIDDKLCKMDVIQPSHYITPEGHECKNSIRYMLGKDGYLDYCRGAAVKYLWRYKNKGNPIKDLEKAAKYIDMMIAELENEEDHA